MLALVAVQEDLRERVKASPLRSAHAFDLIDFAVANPSFTVRRVEREWPRAWRRWSSRP